MSRAGDPSGPVCPLCRRDNVPIVDTTGRGDLAIGEHRYTFPIFPGGYSKPMMRARCPMSGAPLSAICDGDHAPPRCSDPECWRGPPPDAQRCRLRWHAGLAPLIDSPPDGARCGLSADHPGEHSYAADDKDILIRILLPVLDHDGNRITICTSGADSGVPIYVCGCGRALYEHERPECSLYPTGPLVRIGYRAA